MNSFVFVNTIRFTFFLFFSFFSLVFFNCCCYSPPHLFTILTLPSFYILSRCFIRFSILDNMTTNTIPLEDQCSTMNICFNLKPNYTAFLFPNGARQHRFYWMDDGDSFRDLKRDISYLIDPHIQNVYSSLNTETDTKPITTSHNSNSNNNNNIDYL